MFFTYLLFFVVIISLSLNAYLFLLLKKKSKKPLPSYEASELLKDILAGQSLVEIKRIAPENYFLRNPGRF